MNLRRVLFGFVAALVLSTAVTIRVPEPVAAEASVPARVVHFLVDVSGSMSSNNRLEAAKAALTSIVPTLGSDTWAGLRTFGVSSCDTTLNVPPDSIDVEKFIAAVAPLRPSGSTPLAAGLAAAAQDLEDVNAGSKTIVLLADGDNNCGGDPCQVARDIAAKGTELVVNTAGIQLGSSARATLECISAATGGTYTDVTNPEDLTDVISGAVGRQLRYVALGDSYSSGEGAGAGNYYQWYQTWYRCTNTITNRVQERSIEFSKFVRNQSCVPFQKGFDVGCHRAPTAWSFPLARMSSQIIDEVQNTACSGATMSKNLLDRWKENEQPQVNQLRTLNAQQQVDLVTFTIGGNDVGFERIIKACLNQALTIRFRFRDCAREDRRVIDSLKRVDFTRALRELASAAPSATIALVSYPQVVPQTQGATVGCGWLTPSEREAVRRVVGEINLAQWRAVEKAKSEGIKAVFVDITDALVGNELCSSDSHVVRIYGNPLNSEQAHPDSVDRSSSGGTSGQQDLAAEVYRQLIKLGVISA